MTLSLTGGRLYSHEILCPSRPFKVRWAAVEWSIDGADQDSLSTNGFFWHAKNQSLMIRMMASSLLQPHHWWFEVINIQPFKHAESLLQGEDADGSVRHPLHTQEARICCSKSILRFQPNLFVTKRRDSEEHVDGLMYWNSQEDDVDVIRGWEWSPPHLLLHLSFLPEHHQKNINN